MVIRDLFRSLAGFCLLIGISMPGGSAYAQCISESFVSGSVSPTAVSPGGTYKLSCNYGGAVYNAGGTYGVGSIGAPAGCKWSGWSGSNAQYSCTASSTAGSYPISCQLANLPSAGNFCAQTNVADTLQVGNASSSCVQAGFVSGTVSPIAVAPGGIYSLSCNYGAAVYNAGYTYGVGSIAPGPGGCTWSGWNGSNAQYTCTASGTPGSYPTNCQLNNKPSAGNFCAQTNVAGTLQVGNAPVSTASVITTSSDATSTNNDSCVQTGFVSGSVSPTSVVPGGSYVLSCNYGAAVFGTGSIASPEGCTWASWNGNAAQFNCTAPATEESYSVDCTLLNLPSDGNFCAQTNLGGTVQIGAAAPTPVTSDNYVGCYTDNSSSPALPNQLAWSGATVQSCIAAAQSNNYLYAGVEDGGDCFGGNTLGYTLSSNGNCNMPCTANSAEACGGAGYNSIYSTGAAAAVPAQAASTLAVTRVVSLAATADPNASAATRAVYGYLKGLSSQPNHRLISGQWGDWGYVDTALMQRIQNVSGHNPGLVGADYSTLAGGSGGFNTSSVNSGVINYWNQGSLVEIDFLPPDPWTGGGTDTTVGNFNDVITPGTAAYNTYMSYLNAIAPGLQQLQDNGVVVLFRPLMEMEWSGGRWYGGQSGFSQLWAQTFNYLTNTMGLHNLLWVWAVGDDPAGTGVLNYYPGSQYVDVVGIDVYSYGYCNSGVAPPPQDYQGCSNGAAPMYGTLMNTGKVFAITEFGLQTWNFTNNNESALDLNQAVQNIQQDMPAAAYFMAWSTGASGGSAAWELDTQINAGAALNNSWIQNAPVPY